MIINKMSIRVNFSKRFNEQKYIVIHDTGNSNKGAGAVNHYRYFSGGYRGASAHYFVDDSNIVETVDPSMVAWHCGDGKGRNGITNSNSIGIEICINPDSDYQMALAQCRELIRFLMEFYKIPKNRVVRHFDASGKNCPGSMSKDGWKKWKEFYESL